MTDINREVAEKVMGFTHLSGGSTWYKGVADTNLNNEVNSKGYFNPKERIDHAWMVVEKLKQRQYFLILSENPFAKAWKAKFTNIRTPDCDVQEFGDTAPMAICLASLAALEAVKGGD